MKYLAVVLAAVMSLALVAPVFAQPFADVPTDHWAYDAIAELAAKGLIEGYPDGSFKGDRAMTRYEMAMVVARLLARIEAIKIPPLPTDLVRTAQLNAAVAAQTAALRATDTRLTGAITTLQRLVAEFRAELAALGVRVTAVEEELAAIRARLDNTRITGDMRFRFNTFPVGSVSGSGTGRAPDIRLRARLTFTGNIGPHATAVVRLFAANNAGATSFDTRWGNNVFFGNVGFDYLYLDVRDVLKANWRFGRQGVSYGEAPGALYGGYGLLFDPAGTSCAATPTLLQYAPGTSCSGVIDGVRASWTLDKIAIELAQFVESRAGVPTFDPDGPGPLPPVPFFSPPPGLGDKPDRQYQILQLSSRTLVPGWWFQGMYYNQFASPYINAGVENGGWGWGLQAMGPVTNWLNVYGDYASWNARKDPGNSPNWGASGAWRVGAQANFGQMGVPFGTKLLAQYNSYGSPASLPAPNGYAVAPRFNGATTTWFQQMAWDMKGWLFRLDATFDPRWSAFAQYETGNRASDNAGYYEWWLQVNYVIGARTTANLQYHVSAIGGAEVGNQWRLELTTAW